MVMSRLQNEVRAVSEFKRKWLFKTYIVEEISISVAGLTYLDFSES